MKNLNRHEKLSFVLYRYIQNACDRVNVPVTRDL
jgi:hypothetical protein